MFLNFYSIICEEKMNQQNPTIIAILNVVLSYFPDNILSPDSQIYNNVSSTIESFLLNQISYTQLFNTIKSLTGYTKPVEKLQIILQSGPDPIPAPSDDEIARSKYRRKSRPWTSYEDQRLLCAIYHSGIENWTQISKFVGNGRTRSQCSQRWYRGLDPKICKNQWSKEEERKLVDLVRTHGDKSWTNIATKMGNRSDVQCRYRYKQLQRDSNLMRKHKKNTDISDDSSSNNEERVRPRTSKRHQSRVHHQPLAQPKHHQQYQNPIDIAQNYQPMQPVQQIPTMYCMPPLIQQQNQGIPLHQQKQPFQQEIIQVSPLMIHPAQMVQNQQLFQAQMPPQLPPQLPQMPPQLPPQLPPQPPIPPISQQIYLTNPSKSSPPSIQQHQNNQIQPQQSNLQLKQHNSPINPTIQPNKSFDRQSQPLTPFVHPDPLPPITENPIPHEPSPLHVQIAQVGVATQSPGTLLLGMPMPTASPMASIQSPHGYLSIPMSTEVYTVDRMDRSKVHSIQAPAFDGKMYSVY